LATKSSVKLKTLDAFEIFNSIVNFPMLD